MKITIDINVRVTFYHKQTMKDLVIDKRIAQEYNEDSEEYLSLCREHENDIGFPREEDKEKFDKLFSVMLCNRVREEWENRLSTITEVMRKAFLDGYKDNVTGCIELCGYLLNPKDFCAFSVDRFNIRANKA